MQDADEAAKRYLKDEFKKLLADKYIDEWVAVHLDANDRERSNLILNNLKEFAGA